VKVADSGGRGSADFVLSEVCGSSALNRRKPLDTGSRVENIALSLGERVSRDGVFASRRGTGEGSVV
jgi:hypothetical protein